MRRLPDPIEEIRALRRDVSQLKRIVSNANKLAFGGTAVYFTSSSSFVKANYPGLKAVEVELVGGGGAGGGATTTAASEGSVGVGGGGGGYSKKLILASALSGSETVTVGAGGTGVSGSTGNAGGTSSLGSHLSADGGDGGVVNTSAAVVMFANRSPGGTATGGDINIPGGDGMGGFFIVDRPAYARGGPGGSSMLTGGMRGSPTGNASNGSSGYLYGGGGSGGCNPQSQGTARTGGAGQPGIVIVRLIY